MKRRCGTRLRSRPSASCARMKPLARVRAASTGAGPACASSGGSVKPIRALRPSGVSSSDVTVTPSSRGSDSSPRKRRDTSWNKVDWTRRWRAGMGSASEDNREDSAPRRGARLRRCLEEVMKDERFPAGRTRPRALQVGSTRDTRGPSQYGEIPCRPPRTEGGGSVRLDFSEGAERARSGERRRGATRDTFQYSSHGTPPAAWSGARDPLWTRNHGRNLVPQADEQNAPLAGSVMMHTRVSPLTRK